MLFLLYTHVYDFHYRNILTAGKLKRWENRLKCYHNCCLSNAWVTIILRNSVDDFLTSVNLGQKSTVVQNHPQKSHFELSKRSNFYYDASFGIFIWFFKARKKIRKNSKGCVTQLPIVPFTKSKKNYTEKWADTWHFSGALTTNPFAPQIQFLASTASEAR